MTNTQYLDHLPGVGAAVAMAIAVFSRNILVPVFEHHDGGFIHLDCVILALCAAKDGIVQVRLSLDVGNVGCFY